MENRVLVVGLGNPGPTYANNRHNFGFLVLDALEKSVRAQGWQSKFQGQFTSGQLKNQRFFLLKPMTFMNLSGRSVAQAAHFYHFDIEDIIVVHDELDLPFGTVRIKKGGGTAGHKGIASTAQDLKNTDFIRVRMGIDRPISRNLSNYVLENFSIDEVRNLTDVIDNAVRSVESIAIRGLEKAMNETNRRGGKTNES